MISGGGGGGGETGDTFLSWAHIKGGLKRRFDLFGWFLNVLVNN